MRKLWQKRWADFVHLLFPEHCVACQSILVEGEQHLCLQCQMTLNYTHFHTKKENPLWQKLNAHIPTEFAAAYLYFQKKGKTQSILHSIKYLQKPEIATYIGRHYGAILKETAFAQHWDCIIPIPLHKSKLRKRGYNQSTHFAQGLSESLAIPFYENIIGRKKATETQTQKNKAERWTNVEDVFEIENPDFLDQKHILLVDDVITTGATLLSCAQAISTHSQTSKISIATIATAENF